jgi:hypothetical protein
LELMRLVFATTLQKFATLLYLTLSRRLGSSREVVEVSSDEEGHTKNVVEYVFPPIAGDQKSTANKKLRRGLNTFTDHDIRTVGAMNEMVSESVVDFQMLMIAVEQGPGVRDWRLWPAACSNIIVGLGKQWLETSKIADVTKRGRDFLEESMYRTFSQNLAYGAREDWAVHNRTPYLNEQLSAEELVQYDKAGGLGMHPSFMDKDYSAMVQGSGGHFWSVVTSFPQGIGWHANPKNKHAPRPAGMGPFCICVTDSVVPDGKERNIQCWIHGTVIALMLSYNREVALGNVTPAAGSLQYLDARDRDLVRNIAKASTIFLPCHGQGANMCGFQSIAHIRAVVGIVEAEGRRGTPKNMRWPSVHVARTAESEPAAGDPTQNVMLGLNPDDCLAWRARVLESMEKLKAEQLSACDA